MPERIHEITIIDAKVKSAMITVPGREAVDPVGQVDAVRRAGDHEEEQPVPRVGELEVADAGDVDARRQVLVLRGDPDAHGDRAEQDQLPAAVQAQRAAVRQLDEVVEEADRAAGERHEQDGQRRHGVAAEGEEPDRGREQDQQSAHRRRALLGDVVLGAFLADVLAELLAAQEADELRAGKDARSAGRSPLPAGLGSSAHRRERFRDALEPERAGGLDEHDVAGLNELGGLEQLRPRRRRPARDRNATVDIAAGQFADGEQRLDAVPRGLAPDLLVVRGRAAPSSAMSPRIATRRRPAAIRREVTERRPHRDGVRVVGVVDQQAAARQRQLLAAPTRELDLDPLGTRQAERVERRQRCGGVRRRGARP